MDSSDLDAIRAKRMAELQAHSGAGSGSGSGGTSAGGPAGAGGAGEGAQAQAAQFAQEEEKRRGIMSQILSPEARERLSRIALVRPERARAIEALLLRMAQSGQLRGRVSEDQLIGVLDQVEANERKTPGASADGSSGGNAGGKIIFNRRKGGFDSDEDF